MYSNNKTKHNNLSNIFFFLERFLNLPSWLKTEWLKTELKKGRPIYLYKYVEFKNHNARNLSEDLQNALNLIAN